MHDFSFFFAFSFEEKDCLVCYPLVVAVLRVSGNGGVPLAQCVSLSSY